MAKITIIDDDSEMTEHIALILQKDGHSVNAFNDTHGVLEDLVRNPSDLIILDVMFPDNPAAGFEMARKIRRTRGIKDIPIILLTGVNREFPTHLSSTDIDHEWMPAQEFIEKPVNPAKLLKKVRDIVTTPANR